MSVKDDIINELGNIPLEVMKPADSTNYVQQQLEKDSWGRKLNTQTFKQFEDSINILKGSSMYTLNTMVELETLNTEILRLDNKNISQDLDINSKVDFTAYTTKMNALDNKDADLQLQLNNIPNLYVDKTKYNTKMTSLDLKDTELTTLVNSKVDSNVYSTNISNLQSQISSKVSNTTYTNDLNSINIKNNNQDSLINNLQSNKADILYVDSQIDILENVNTVQDNAIDNLILTKADKSDVFTKLEMNSTLNNYALKSYVDGTFLTTTNASSTYVSLADYNNSELIHSNEILSLQNGKANITDIYTRTEGDQRYLPRSEYTGGTGTSQIATQPEVDAGVDDTKIVTSKTLKARLDSLLAGIASTYVKLTQLATESIAGIVKISTTAQVSAGTDNTTAISPAKLKELYTSGSSKTQNGYQKLPSGIILQWGTIDYNSNPGEILVDVVFPSVFPTSCLNVTATRKTLANSLGDGGVGIVSYSSGSVKFQLGAWGDGTWDEGISGVRGFTWFAIGY